MDEIIAYSGENEPEKTLADRPKPLALVTPSDKDKHKVYFRRFSDTQESKNVIFIDPATMMKEAQDTLGLCDRYFPPDIMEDALGYRIDRRFENIFPYSFEEIEKAIQQFGSDKEKLIAAIQQDRVRKKQYLMN